MYTCSCVINYVLFPVDCIVGVRHVGGVGNVFVHYCIRCVCCNACAFNDVLHLWFVYRYAVLPVPWFVLLLVLVC
jgi:hypothetical protein